MLPNYEGSLPGSADLEETRTAGGERIEEGEFKDSNGHSRAYFFVIHHAINAYFLC